VLLIPALRLHSALEGAFVAIPIAVYLGFAMESRINIGLRHILPVYPFVLMAAAAAAKQLLVWRPLVGRSVLAVSVAVWLAGFAAVYPHTLTFFNVFAGGPGGGLAYLSDSNLDWGQDLKPLKSWMEQKKLAHINLAYFGTASPDYYGIRCTHLPGAPFFAEASIAKPVLPGYVAISSTILSGVYLTPDWRLFYRGFLSKQPVATIGNSIRVYWVESWPDAGAGVVLDEASKTHAALADRLLFNLRWPDLAAVHYQRSLDLLPADTVTRSRLGLALFESGETVRAIDTLHLAVRANPADGEVRSLLASALLRDRQVAEAEEHAREAVTLRADDPVAHDVLGVVLAVTGRTEPAKLSFKRALELAPDFEDARFHLERLEEYVKSR
jgi:tetratricopeptide (TPR) repeat protein